MRPGAAFRTQRSSPSQSNAEIARHTFGPVGDLKLDAISARLQIFFPKEEELLWKSCKSFLPARLLLIDGASAVCAEPVRETANFNFGNAVVDRAFYDCSRALHPFLVGYTRRLFQLLEQSLLL